MKMDVPIGGDNAVFLDLYARFLRDRDSVPADWVVYFEALEGGAGAAPVAGGPAQAAVAALLDGYRRDGHLEARLDPLATGAPRDPALERLAEAALRHAGAAVELTLGGDRQRLPAAEAVARIRALYAGPAALEAAHLDGEAERDWWYAAFERGFAAAADESLLAAAAESVVLTDEFESFMRSAFPTQKRFGIEGGETAIVFLRELLRQAPGHGTAEVVMGGMHRGRLATLAVALGKSPALLAAELKGRDLSDGAAFTGDVPYHLGHAAEVGGPDGPLRLTLLPHPSHLLVVAPVALGLARATARASASGSGAPAGSALCLLLHTDAAFSGQGLTAELLQIGGLAGYSAGGSIHLVVNNQIGFTTLPSEGRSTRHCTDVGKGADVPILHVNGDDPVAVARVARLAIAWQTRFRRDVIVDLVCYRRHGHNEFDEPRFTQPRMWAAIDRHPGVREQFSARVLAGRPALSRQAAATAADFRARLQAGLAAAGDVAPDEHRVQRDAWSRLARAGEDDLLQPVVTGVEAGRLAAIGLESCLIPADVAANPRVRKFYALRAETIRSGRDINFATAEALAFGSLLADGASVRLSGQDAVRGTFTQRHLAVHDAATGAVHRPLARVARRPEALELVNSPLSEYGVLSFEYGHSLHDPGQLTVWEAQFGDFLNGAQVVVDQYIVCAEAKWRLQSGLVVMLPHGLEGQGPDHSSARIERLALLAAGGNIVLAQPSTPANLFHLLRRQLVAPWRKPLLLITPKSLLRARAAVSALAEMGQGTAFRPVIAEQRARPGRIRRIVACTGKVFYALDEACRQAGLADAILPVRVEQIHPLPHAELKAIGERHRQAEWTWLQEEPENQGAWPFLRGEFERHGLRFGPALPVVARPALSVTAGGSIERHEREQKALLGRLLASAGPI